MINIVFISDVVLMPKQTISVMGAEISVLKYENQEYLSITDMIKSKDGDFFVSDWLRNRNTIEFLSIWEEVHNPKFNYGQFATIKSKVGLNNYKISTKERAEKTNAIGLIAKSGRYGGTFAHKDIAFEFAMRISPKFKVYLIKEFQRLKELELKSMDRNVKRFLTKMNYKIHTDAIKNKLIPLALSKEQISYIYASEADVLNIALFGHTAKERSDKNQTLKGNIRDQATIEQLIVLANIESMNAEYIKLGFTQTKRLALLNQTAISQMQSLLGFEINKISGN